MCMYCECLSTGTCAVYCTLLFCILTVSFQVVSIKVGSLNHLVVAGTYGPLLVAAPAHATLLYRWLSWPKRCNLYPLLGYFLCSSHSRWFPLLRFRNESVPVRWLSMLSAAPRRHAFLSCEEL